MVAIVLLAAVWFRFDPAPTIVDNWGSSLIHPHPHDAFWLRIAEFRSPAVLGIGSVLAGLVVAGRDRGRALVCLVGPALAVALTEYVLKTLIARRSAPFLDFPSGTTTAVAALATSWVLAVPRRWRPVVTGVGAVVVVLECVAVVTLQWHLATDALGGILVGVGVLLLLDGGLHLVVRSRRRADRSGTTGATDVA